MRMENEKLEGCEFIIRKNEKSILNTVAKNFKEYEGPIDIVMDIGAHIGELSILAAKCGARLVLAIEPDLNNFQLLLANIVANNFEDKIIPLYCVVWDRMGVSFVKMPKRRWEFWKKRNTCQRSLLYKSKFPDNAEGAVPTVTLEWVFDHFITFGYADYMKMDIEGAEHAVLLATPIEAMRKVRFIDLDLHDPSNTEYFDWNQWSSEITLDHLRECGFNIATGIREGKIMANNKEMKEGYGK